MLSVDTTVPSPIEVGAWSPTMDIIALALESEEVLGVRTSVQWQCIWTIKEDEGKINSLVDNG